MCVIIQLDEFRLRPPERVGGIVANEVHALDLWRAGGT
jgi:hypothetical protein